MRAFFKYNGQKVFVFDFQDKNDRVRHNLFDGKYNEFYKLSPGNPKYIAPEMETTVFDSLTLEEYDSINIEVNKRQKENDKNKKLGNPNDDYMYIEYMATVGQNILDFISTDIDALLECTGQYYCKADGTIKKIEEKKQKEKDKEGEQEGKKAEPVCYFQAIGALPEVAMGKSYFIGACIDDLYDFDNMTIKKEGYEHFILKQKEYREILSIYLKASEKRNEEIKKEREFKHSDVRSDGKNDCFEVELNLDEIKDKVNKISSIYNKRNPWKEYKSIDKLLETELAYMATFEVNLFRCQECNKISVGRVGQKRCDGWYDVKYDEWEITPRVMYCALNGRWRELEYYRNESGQELLAMYKTQINRYKKSKSRGKEVRIGEEYKKCVACLKEWMLFYQECLDEADSPEIRQKVINYYGELFNILYIKEDIEEWIYNHSITLFDVHKWNESLEGE